MTVKLFPAIAIVPTRGSSRGLGLKVNLTVPSPLPFAPPGSVIAIQSELLLAVQSQPDVALTSTKPAPPLPLTVCLEADNKYSHRAEPSATRQTPRPCVKAYKLRVPLAVLTPRDSTTVFGKPEFSTIQLAPPSAEVKTPMSVPM